MSRFKISGEWMLFRIFTAILYLLPRGWIRALGRVIGDQIFRWDRKHRTLSLSNIKAALGSQLTPAEQYSTARQAFRHFGCSFLDMLHLARLKPEKRNKLITIEGLPIIHRALKQGNGALLISAHYGLWEMAPALLSQYGKLGVVARPLDNPRLENHLLKLRQGMGAEVIYKFQASKPILRILRRNGMVAILMDQNVLRKEAVFVDFFGKKAATTPATATFYLRTGAPIIPVFCLPGPEQKYHIKIQEPIDIKTTGKTSDDIHHITQACTTIIEKQIRCRPEFWFWFHNRWKTRPE